MVKHEFYLISHLTAKCSDKVNKQVTKKIIFLELI
jgi:hypothetical protein